MVLMKAAIAKGFRIGLDGRSATEAQARSTSPDALYMRLQQNI